MPLSRAERERARQRATWPIARFTLGQEPNEDLSASTTIQERLAMMRSLAETAWSVVPREQQQDSAGGNRLFVRRPVASRRGTAAARKP